MCVAVSREVGGGERERERSDFEPGPHLTLSTTRRLQVKASSPPELCRISVEGQRSGRRAQGCMNEDFLLRWS